MRGSDYAELRAFVAIVEHGSFVRAAAHLAITPSALSQTIRVLEQRLGVRLLNRTTRSVAPSEAGARLLLRLQPALNALDGALASVTEAAGEPAGLLRINASRDAAVHYLAPLLGPFMLAYPRIRLEISCDDRLVDMVAGGFDAGIRLGERLEQDMIAVPLSGPLEMALVASPDYLRRCGTPQHPSGLSEHQCLSYYRPTDGSRYRWEFSRDGQRVELAVAGSLLVNEPAMLTPVVLAGAGISYQFYYQVAEHLASGRLVRLLADWTPPFAGFYLYYPSRHMPLSLRLLVDFITAQRLNR